MGVITAIRRNVKNVSRCSVFVDDEFFAACPIDVAAALGLRKGLEMTDELERRLRQEDRRVVLRQKAYRFATYKPRTVRQVQEHLEKLEATPEEVEDVVAWLEEFNLVDDEAYAERFLLAAQDRKPLSPSDARQKLRRKGVPDDIVDAAIESSFDEEQVFAAAVRVAQKKIPSLKGDLPTRKQKLIQFLQYRGYTWQVVRNVVDHMQDSLVLILVLITAVSSAISQGTQSCDKVRLPEAINSFQPTTLPVLSPDGHLYLDRKLHPDNGDGITDPDDVWIAKRRSAVAWGEPTRAPFTVFRRPDVLFNFTPDGLRALVVGRYHAVGSDSVPAFAIISRRSSEELFDKIDVLDVGEIGANYYGFLTGDAHHVLVAVERSGGAGDLDLFVTSRCEDRWTPLQALSDSINTAGLEGSPWVSRDGRTLYFVSNGRDDRRGKADIYISRRRDDSWLLWSTPVNVGSCFNSQEEETSVSLSPSETKAYLTSWDPDASRPGVYLASLPEDMRPSSVCTYTPEVLDGATMEPLLNYRVLVTDSLALGDTCEVTVYESDTLSGSATICIPEGHSYKLETVANGYTRHQQTITVRDLDSTVSLVTTVRVFRLDRPLASVFFERGSAAISDSALTAIADVVEKYGRLKVQFYVDGYTDRVGGDETNELLSEERAKVVAEQLIGAGMDARRVSVAGRGVERLPGVYDDEHPQSRRVDVFARTAE